MELQKLDTRAADVEERAKIVTDCVANMLWTAGAYLLHANKL